MDRVDTIKVLAILKAAYPGLYKDTAKKDLDGIVNLWTEMFADEPVELVAAGVKSLIASDTKGYPPHIGAVKNAIHGLTKTGELDAAEAWELVRKAVSNGYYGASEEFKKLPENVQRMVGSPSQLRDWATMDSDTFNSVIGSNFQRNYRVRQESERKMALMPADVRKMISGLAGTLALEEGGSE